MKREFCLNSGRWIEIMALKGRPPKSCPRRTDNFSTCEYCGYYKMKEESNYIKKFRKMIRRCYE